MKKRCCRDPKIGLESRLRSKSMMEFEAKIPNKLGCPIAQVGNSELKLRNLISKGVGSI